MLCGLNGWLLNRLSHCRCRHTRSRKRNTNPALDADGSFTNRFPPSVRTRETNHNTSSLWVFLNHIWSVLLLNLCPYLWPPLLRRLCSAGIPEALWAGTRSPGRPEPSAAEPDSPPPAQSDPAVSEPAYGPDVGRSSRVCSRIRTLMETDRTAML